MANRDLLKEAIADAKSVKEAAIANAKAALEEAFTPYLKEKFSAKLAEMEAEEMEEAKEEMDENTSEDSMEEMSNPVMRKGLKGDDTEEKRTEKMREEEETMDEMDLDELLAELDEEMGKEEEMEETLNEQEEEEMEMDSEEEVEGEEEDEIDLEDMTEEELKDLIEDVIEDMVRAGELEAGEKFEEEDEEEDIDIDMEDEEEMVSERAYYGKNKGDKPRKSTAKEKDELLKEEEDMMDESLMDKLNKVIKRMKDNAAAGRPLIDDEMFSFVDKADLLPPGLVSKGMEKSGAGKTSSVGEAEEMEEMRKEIEELASTLAETKLLNAKLLYSNKIFRAKNLTETQKVKVLEAFDKASTVKDAKLIYETLTAIKETKPPVNESVRGMASKAAGLAPEKKPILEVNDQFARWQVLAGIKNN
jgi:hypothetical protein